jgi:hypothetical protein
VHLADLCPGSVPDIQHDASLAVAVAPLSTGEMLGPTSTRITFAVPPETTAPDAARSGKTAAVPGTGATAMDGRRTWRKSRAPMSWDGGALEDIRAETVGMGGDDAGSGSGGQVFAVTGSSAVQLQTGPAGSSTAMTSAIQALRSDARILGLLAQAGLLWPRNAFPQAKVNVHTHTFTRTRHHPITFTPAFTLSLNRSLPQSRTQSHTGRRASL